MFSVHTERFLLYSCVNFVTGDLGTKRRQIMLLHSNCACSVKPGKKNSYVDLSRRETHCPMVAIIAALAATLYITGTIVWSLAFFSTFDDRLIQALPQYKMVTEAVTSMFAENPLHVMVLKFVFVMVTKAFGGFRKLSRIRQKSSNIL
jgi:hypothetical protein